MTRSNSGQTDARSGRTRSAVIIADRRRKDRRRRLMLQIGIGLVAVVAVLGTTIAVLSSQGQPADVASPSNLTPEGGLVLGSRQAPVRVAIVEDFGCPHCKAFEAQAAALLDSYQAGSTISVEYRGIAFLDRAFTSDYSSRALNASACVAANAGSEVWKRFHDMMFENQPAEGSDGLDTQELVSTAAAAGAGASATADCIAAGGFRDWGKAQTASTLGHGGVDGTPTVFVNGVKLEQASVAALEQAVRTASAP